MNLRYFAWREVGRPTHNYWYESDTYYRQALSGGPAERWDGQQWVIAEVAEAAA